MIPGAEAAEITRKWFSSGFKKAGDLAKRAVIKEKLLTYIPFWRKKGIVMGTVAGQIERKDSENKTYFVDKTYFVEKNLDVNTAACKISEFGVRSVNLEGDDILPFDINKTDKEGVTFEISGTEKDIEENFQTEREQYKREQESKLDKLQYKRWYSYGRKNDIIYYPLWVIKYQYREKLYQVVIDGEDKRILSGRAPGSILFRAISFTITTFISLNGLILGARYLYDNYITTTKNSNMGFGLIAGLIIVAIFIFVIGFKHLRYGGEIIIGENLD